VGDVDGAAAWPHKHQPPPRRQARGTHAHARHTCTQTGRQARRTRRPQVSARGAYTHARHSGSAATQRPVNRATGAAGGLVMRGIVWQGGSPLLFGSLHQIELRPKPASAPLPPLATAPDTPGAAATAPGTGADRPVLGAYVTLVATDEFALGVRGVLLRGGGAGGGGARGGETRGGGSGGGGGGGSGEVLNQRTGETSQLAVCG